MRMSRRLVRTVQGVTCAAALLVGGSLALNADIGGDADLQLQLGSLLYDETRYQEALVAFTEAAKSDDARVAVAGRKGTVRTALKVAEFLRARQEAEELVKVAARIPRPSHFMPTPCGRPACSMKPSASTAAAVDRTPGRRARVSVLRDRWPRPANSKTRSTQH